MFGCKAGTGGAVEVLVERLLGARRVLAQLRASKAPKPGSEILLLDDEGREAARVRVLGRHEDMFELEFPADRAPLAVMESIGHMPLPPYIDREDAALDRERYQTVYAARDGAVAAPTAGLHFDEALIEALRAAGVETRVSHAARRGRDLPAGALRGSRGASHARRVHRRARATVRASCAPHAEGRRVIAVGTTSLRGLEAASDATAIRPYTRARPRLFIYPGYRFRVRRCADHQFSPAGVHAADAGQRLRRPRARAGGLRGGGRARLPLLQLRRCDVRPGRTARCSRLLGEVAMAECFMQFALLARDGAARRGRLQFPRGEVETPASCPWAPTAP